MTADVGMPFEQPHPLAPAPVLRALQQQCPVHRVRTRVGDEAWLVTGYDEVKALYAGEKLSRSHPRPEKAARLTDSALFGGRPRENYEREDTDRAWFRSVLHTVMSPGALRELRPSVDTLVTTLLDDLSAAPRPADVVDLIAVPLPTLVICRMMGVPDELVPRCRDLSADVAAAGDAERSGAGLDGLTELLRELVTSGGAAPGGLLARLRQAPYRLPVDAIAQIGASLLFTGHHTTVVAIGYAVLLLLADPEQHRALREHPERLDDAVEEFLRVGNAGVNTGGGNGIPTYARADLEIGGSRIRAGDLVLLDTGAANHDEKVFDDPYTFDIARPARAHLTFGHGRHYCPGAGLARLEIKALFAQLLPRFPGLRLAVGVERLRAHDDQITGGLVALPVTW